MKVRFWAFYWMWISDSLDLTMEAIVRVKRYVIEVNLFDRRNWQKLNNDGGVLLEVLGYACGKEHLRPRFGVVGKDLYDGVFGRTVED